MADYKEGQTATNPKTQQMIVFKNGQWVSAGAPSAPGGPVAGPQFTKDEAARRIGIRARTGTPLVRMDQDPYAYIRDPKQRAIAQAQGLAGVRKETSDGRVKVAKAQTGSRIASQVEDITNRVSTGGLTGWLRSTGLGSMVLGNSDTERMNQIGLEIARNSRVPGEGAISDYDARQFKQMAPGMDKRPETNRAWAAAARGAEKAVEEKQQFMEAFGAANQTLEGADAIWNEYQSTAGRIFDDKGHYNGTRTPWREWVKQKNQTYQKALAPAQGGFKVIR